MSVVVITPPAPLVSLALAKQQVRVDGDDQDAIIQSRIGAASASIDGPNGWLGRAIGTQTLEWTTSAFPAGSYFHLPYDPVQSVTSVTYLDSLGVSQVWGGANYQLDGRMLLPAYGVSWPSARYASGAVKIRWVAGMNTIPDEIVNATLLQVEILHDRPEGAALEALERARDNLLQPYRNLRV